MLLSRSRRIKTLLATAAAVAGTQGLVASVACGQGQASLDLEPTIGQEIAAPDAVIDRAQALADQGKLVHAYEVLSDLLTASGIDLTDQERARAMSLSVSINHRIQQLDSYEVSLQRADYCLSRDDLRTAIHHARAVASSSTATPDQIEQANKLLRTITARQQAIAPAMHAKLKDALQAMKDGRYAQAKAALNSVSRSGVTLSSKDHERLVSAQEQILLLETSRGAPFDNGIVAAGLMQPGVVKRQDKDAAEQAADEVTDAAEDLIEEAEKQLDEAAQEAQPENSQPIENLWDEDGNPIEPADTSAAWPSQPEPAAEQAQPETTPPPSQPEGNDLVHLARSLEAQGTLADADAAFAEGRWADAKAKYQRVVSQFSDILNSDDLARAKERIDEASINMGSRSNSLLDEYVDTHGLEASQKRAEFEHAIKEARAKLASGDIDGARDAAAAAQVTLSTARSRQLFPESEWEEKATELSKLKSDIAAERELQARLDAAAREDAAAKAAIVAEVRRERERAQKITEAIDRVRALQQEMKYREALDVVENQILFLDPINPSGLVLRDILRDNIIYTKYGSQHTEQNVGFSYQSIENGEAAIPPAGIINYPSDWPAISARRAGVESSFESPADRRVLATLNNTPMPVNFQDNTLENVLNFIGTFAKIDMDVDWDSLEEIGIDRETTVSLNLKHANAKTVLDRVLEKVSTDPITQADWAIIDGMLQIASEDRIRRHTIMVPYEIRDLVFEVPDYTDAPTIDLQSVLQNSQGGGGGSSPFDQTNNDLGFDQQPLQDRIDKIKEIIVRNVDEESWPEGGGTTGAMYELNGNLFIRNTPKNHRQIRDLLSKLRAAKSMQINVETRFLLVSQDFFEQIGFDLDVYFNANNNQIRAAQNNDPNVNASDFFDFTNTGLQRSITGPPPLSNGNNQNNNGISQPVVNPSPWSPIGTVQDSLGLASALMPTEGLASTILGQAPALGIAGQFLDDIQVDFLVKATQADRRSMQLTAPRLTFTNGQTSNIFVVTQQSFVSQLAPIVSNSAVGFNPTLSVVSEGVVMLVTGQVTADRRYVLLNISTSVSKIDGFDSQPVTAVAGGQLVNSADTQSFIQLPTVTVTQVQTTVTVPDQGTVLLGGQRLITESDVETGVPVLSKIPILNRFFSNRIESREEQTLLILIKPTVLIQSEQENEAFPGLSESLGLGG